MSKSALISLLVVVLALGGLFFFLSSGDDAETSTETNTTQTTEVSEAPSTDAEPEAAVENEVPEGVQTYTDADVAMHATEDDCWTIINGNVYDITSYLPRHPGGDTILQACGADGTSLFTERTTNDGETVGSGTPHSGNATSQLQSLIIGTLGL